jgi:hypothetical protein
MHARRSRSEWARIVRAFERSGQSHADFCAERGLRVWSFRSWLYRMRRDRAGSSAADLVLLPVSVATPAPVAPPSALVIAVAGVEVRVAVGTDVAYVAGLVAELRSRC